jgi:hypothetical protein
MTPFSPADELELLGTPMTPPELADPTSGVQRDDVMCRVARLEYDFVARTGCLHLPAQNCVDMTGCIALFTAIDADVRHIRTVRGRLAGGTVEDTCYRRPEGGPWYSYRLPTG